MANEIYDIGLLTHGQVRRFIDGRPAIIIPLGGCEPFGAVGAMGVESVCAAGVAGELSGRCRVLAAPVVPFGCSTPFISFPGAAGIKPRTFINMLCEVIRAYIFQGFSQIILISAAPFNNEPAGEVLKRMDAKYPNIKIGYYDINKILDKDKWVDRDDALLLSLYAYLRPDQPIHPQITIRQDMKDQYRTWKKRGRDPEKLKKLFRDGLLMIENEEISPERGRDYFERIVEIIYKEIEMF
jgi:creatinine amidohydrolase/Fe(II)-dependent formamide hydrolase-like protein